MFDKNEILFKLLSLPAILFCLSIHELAHGWVANKLGDNTARNFGRLTLSPLKHIDPIGFLALLLVGFGWAKPVPVNMRNFNKPKRDMALTALAGPVSNLLSAFVFAFILGFYELLLDRVIVVDSQKTAQILTLLYYVIYCFVGINISLAIFNLIPIPPLDGSRILDCFLPQKAYVAYHKYEQYVSLALMAILIFTNILTPFLAGARDIVEMIILYIPEKVFSLL